VKCNNNVDMQYVADQGECQLLAITSGHPYYSFRHNGEGSGHKCMSSSHCNDHLTDRTNDWHIYAAGGFHYGVVATNFCEAAAVSEAHCLEAVQHLLPEGQVQGRTHLVAGSWGWVPPGCSVQSHFTHNQNGDWAAHYNRNPSGANDGGYTPVCNMSPISFVPDCAPALMGNDDSSSAGVPDGASAIQFIDLTLGGMSSSGQVTSFSYYVARANQAGLKFQIYRPVSGNTYHLVSESEVLASPSTGTDSHVLATPLDFQAGDFIGWVHTGQGTFPFEGGSGSVRWKYGIEAVGSNINFDGAGARKYAYLASLLMC